MPALIYAATVARPRQVKTPLGTVSFHRIPPALFTGFELTREGDAKLATPEKALFDTLYLAPSRSLLSGVLRFEIGPLILPIDRQSATERLIKCHDSRGHRGCAVRKVALDLE